MALKGTGTFARIDQSVIASKTESDLTLYVYEDATGLADGSSKANGFVTLQDAIDAIPDVAQNVTVIVCKGSTNYLGQTTTIQKASVKSLTIQGEYYWYDSCDANAVAGKIVDANIVTTGMAVGDRVVCTHYSGTVGSSSIDDYFYATITEVGSGYVQTSEGSKVPTTGWRYLINQTVFKGTDQAASASNTISNCVINGISFATPDAYNGSDNAIVKFYRCIITNCKNLVSTQRDCGIFVFDSYLGGNNANVLLYNWNNSQISCHRSVFKNTPGLYNYNDGNGVYASNCGFFTCYYAIKNSNAINVTAQNCYIASTCTYGAYGYNITLVDCTNNATTPVTNLTSGGSIEEWDGQALPSIADATGGQVLALKSDKSALEFATVSGGTSSYDDLTDIPAAISAIDGLTPAANKMPYYTAADSGALADLPSGYNYIINPCFEVNQRQVASVTGNGAFPVDRWVSSTNTTGSLTLSQQAFTVGQTDVPGEPKNYLRAVVASDSTAGEYIMINHKIEDVRTLAGQTCVFSFWAKADASRSIAIECYHGYGSGGSSPINSNGNNKIAVTTSWTRYFVTLTMPSLSGKTVGAGSSVWVNFWLSGGSTYNPRTGSLGNQSGTFEFANVKLEAGSIATPFRVPTYAEELLKCQRYFINITSGALLGNARRVSTNQITQWAMLPVAMRVAPTLLHSSPSWTTNMPSTGNDIAYIDQVNQVWVAITGTLSYAVAYFNAAGTLVRVTLTASTSFGGSPGTNGGVILGSAVYFWLSAEL